MNTTFKKTKDLVNFIYSDDFNESIYPFFRFKNCNIKERTEILFRNLNVSKFIASEAAKMI